MSPAGPALTMDDISPYYKYIPTLSACIVMTVAFGLSGAVHMGQAFHYRLRYLYYTAGLAGILECIGWISRLVSHFKLKNLPLYLIQTIMTLDAPTFLIAGYFIALGEVIRRLGPCYSRLQPKMYTIIFCGADFIALTVQGIGGGLAATAAASTTGNKNGANLGANVMLAGIVFQMVALFAYLSIASEFLIRYTYDKPIQRANSEPPSGNYTMDKKMKTMLYALGLGSILLFVRSIYRTVELANGWNGHIITTEIYFIILDGLMIISSMLLFNFFHPGRLLGPPVAVKEAPSTDNLLKKNYV